MMEPFAVGPYLCVRYRPFVGSPLKNDRILDECVAHPERFTLPMTRDDIRLTAAWYLTDPDNAAFEVWNGGAFCGILLMDQIVPGIGARWHFMFFDGDLAGKRTLLLEFLRRAFAAGLERVTLEVPEHVATLISFARRKLGFRYEGESRTMPNSLNVSAVWAARQGSRHEHAYRSAAGEWLDIVVLRLLASELPCP